MSTTTTYNIYDQDGEFVHFVLDRDEAYQFAQDHEQVPSSWEVRAVTRESMTDERT
jgi:membrane carboxypeptidase/penicillin-binding protein PbpC